MFFLLEQATWQKGIGAYFMSFAGDLFDGYFARKLNQCSTLGAVLDMVTDRVSTAVLLVLLTHFNPAYTFHFMFLIALDFSSHWFHMYASKGHHKAVAKDRNFILRAFYEIYVFFGFCCVGTEFFYVALAILNYAPNFALGGISLYDFTKFFLFPACVCKQIVNVAQLLSSMNALAEDDVRNKKA